MLEFQNMNMKKLKKGINCLSCHSFDISISRTRVICNKCGCVERVESAVLRNVEELKNLFPEIRLTTNLVYEWCKVVNPKKKIRKILLKKFNLKGHGKYSYFEDNKGESDK